MGVSVYNFWSMTPAEFDAYCFAYQKRKVTEHNEAITQSYFTAIFTRTEKLQPLEKYLVNEDKKELSKEDLEKEKLELLKLFEG